MAVLLAREYFWPGYANEVKKFARNCHKCRAGNSWKDRREGLLKPLLIPLRVWQELSVDFVVDLPKSDGCTNLMVVTDRLSKGVIL
ncbi:integrase zinc binding domain-containing protein, partial [Stenotrophomonas sp. MA5]|uniref:integrase zinc binding domain-containing protein n=1 Tax=Stenotrophomonas sp. MA5 TaxID=2508572 RepID=UPI00240D523F